ncbi:MAG TPA: hypothetical protein VFI23_15510 [Rhizomicrobium sp.]|nr:hypothetical protein [Rhizomicrobium sp.]
MEQQIFADGIGQVTVIGGAVRLDFVTYSATEKDPKGQPVPVFCQRVVMSLEGFMQSAAKFQEAAIAVSTAVQRARESQPQGAASAPQAAPVPQPAAPGEAAPAKRPFP